MNTGIKTAHDIWEDAIKTFRVAYDFASNEENRELLIADLKKKYLEEYKSQSQPVEDWISKYDATNEKPIDNYSRQSVISILSDFANEAAEKRCYTQLKYVYDHYSIGWDESDSAKIAMVLFECEKNIMGEEIIESLEDTAENYARKPYYRNGGTLSVAPQLYLKRGFIEGAKWYASQHRKTYR